MYATHTLRAHMIKAELPYQGQRPVSHGAKVTSLDSTCLITSLLPQFYPDGLQQGQSGAGRQLQGVPSLMSRPVRYAWLTVKSAHALRTPTRVMHESESAKGTAASTKFTTSHQ